MIGLNLLLDRVCTRCRLAKPRTEFSGTHHRCRSCNAASQAEWRARDPERCKAKSRRWYAKNRVEMQRLARERMAERKIRDPIGVMLKRKRYNAERLGIPFDLASTDIVIPEFCQILGIRLAPIGSPDIDARPSIDRLDPSKGYVRGNVAVISNKANRIKSDGTAEHHERIAAWMRAQGGSNG